MELCIAEKVLERRRSLNLTQEELASRIGVSSQAISNWERKAGYPDVTMIPPLAEALGISTDELLGVGQETAAEVLKRFKDELRATSDIDVIKALMLDYYHRYPNNYSIMERIIWCIYRRYSNNKSFVDLAKDIGERIMNECTDTGPRITARKVLSFICDDEEAEKYINEFDDNILLRSNVTGRRLWRQDRRDDARAYFSAERIIILRYLVHRALYCSDCPEKAVEWCEFCLNMIKLLGGGEVPDGWLDMYGFTILRLSALHFAADEGEKGYILLEEALSVYDKWYSLPDNKPLSVGITFCSDKVAVARINGTGRILIDNVLYGEAVCETDIVEALSESGLEGFETVRGTERFRNIAARAVTIRNKHIN